MEAQNQNPNQINKDWFMRHRLFLATLVIVILGSGVIYQQELNNRRKHIDTSVPAHQMPQVKTYTSSALNYSVDYPADWIVDSEQEQIHPANPDMDNGVASTYFKVETDNRQLEQVLEQLRKKVGGQNLMELEDTLDRTLVYTFREENPVRGEDGEISGLAYEVIVPHMGKVYHILTQKYNLEDVNSIIQSFKFTDTPPPSTVLKTYTNTKYGFEFQYPSDWDITEDVQKNTVYGDMPATHVINNNLSFNIEGLISHPQWQVSYVKDIYDGSIDKYLDSSYTKDEIVTNNQIDGHLTYSITTNYQDRRIVFINGYVFELQGSKSAMFQGADAQIEGVFNKILSSFKFNSNDAKALNKEIKVDFQFPSSWYLWGSKKLSTNDCCLELFSTKNPYDDDRLNDDVMKVQFQYTTNPTSWNDLTENQKSIKEVQNNNGLKIYTYDYLREGAASWQEEYLIALKPDLSEYILVLVWNPKPEVKQVFSTFKLND